LALVRRLHALITLTLLLREEHARAKAEPADLRGPHRRSCVCK
jgi:hypothetical protein